MIFLGIAITFCLYLIAKTFNLYLTFLTLRYFVGVSLIIFVVIFQSEIKRYFEFLGVIGTRQIKARPFLEFKSPSTYDIIQACVKMAQSKTGALIVLQAKDNLEQFVDGGTHLDGVISEDVLLSIFDPHSEGHDGALIINNNRISKFGAHLPLSTNFKEIGKHGTRHSAGLGLSELTDALCIVVSEEKGKISICKDGKMKTLNQYSDLEKELEKYIKEKFGASGSYKFTDFFRLNFGLKLGAVIFAALIWFITAYQAGIIEKTYSVPITIDELPKDVIIESYNPKEITLTVSGRGESVFSGVKTEDFKIIFDASSLENGTGKQTLTRKNIVLPTNLSLEKFEPEQFLLTSQKYYSARIPVTAKTKGDVANGQELKSIQVIPEFVEVWVPLESPVPFELVTEIIDISTQNESVIIPVKLVVPDDLRLVNGDSTVNVALTVEQRN
jgi:uncharacterized protein (TIGR00159 family)